MSFDALPHSAWPDIAAALALPWPRAAAEHDLRWHAAEYGVHRRALPDVRTLAARWGWTRTRVHDLIHGAPVEGRERRPPTWPDMARPWPWAIPDKLRTSSGQAPDSRNGSTPTINESPDTIRTRSGHDPDSRAQFLQAPDHPITQDGEGGGPAREDAPRPAEGEPEAPAPPPEPSADAPPPASATPTLDLPMVLDGDVRLLAPLAAAGVATLDALCALTASELRHRPGIGPKRLVQVVEALARHGLALAAEAPPPKAPPERPGLRRLTDGWCKAYLDTTGQAYRWTPTGRDSDQRAAAELYDALGWTAEPTDEVRRETHHTVARYLDHCRQSGRIATLPDLVRQLARWRQEPGVRVRAGPEPARRASGADEARDAIAQALARARATHPSTAEAL